MTFEKCDIKLFQTAISRDGKVLIHTRRGPSTASELAVIKSILALFGESIEDITGEQRTNAPMVIRTSLRSLALNELAAPLPLYDEAEKGEERCRAGQAKTNRRIP